MVCCTEAPLSHSAVGVAPIHIHRPAPPVAQRDPDQRQSKLIRNTIFEIGLTTCADIKPDMTVLSLKVNMHHHAPHYLSSPSQMYKKLQDKLNDYHKLVDQTTRRRLQAQ